MLSLVPRSGCLFKYEKKNQRQKNQKKKKPKTKQNNTNIIQYTPYTQHNTHKSIGQASKENLQKKFAPSGKLAQNENTIEHLALLMKERKKMAT